MEAISTSSKNAPRLVSYLSSKLSSFTKSMCGLMKRSYRFIILRGNPFLIQLCYFISISLVGFLALKILEHKYEVNRPKNLDLFFMSVSALTVSSMSTVEMEAFRNFQLWVLILLMLVGGEVFTSMLGLQFMKTKLKYEGVPDDANLKSRNPDNHIELEFKDIDVPELTRSALTWSGKQLVDRGCMNHDSIRYLGFVVLGYLIVINVGGSVAILLYLSFVASARDVLKMKRIPISTYSIFTAISSFGNCGFTPTNENMMVFKKDSTLLLLIVPQILAGNTLYPPCLRFTIWVLEKITRREEFKYILRNPRAIRYEHSISNNYTAYLASTVLWFLVVQIILFCSLEWNSEALQGLTSYQKVVGALFQSVNSRHAGESIIDISILSPSILVLYVVMMYLPPYTSFLPIRQIETPPLDEKEGDAIRQLLKALIFSNLSYLVTFVALICITERNTMLDDPLNFSVFNIVFEVISGYGNVGFSIGYSCERLIKPDSNCKDAYYGFVGRWSDKGKLIFIVVMIFGRLKKFNTKGGKAWKLN